MEKRKLGKTDIEVSLICLGTMTWGEQNTEDEAHEQMDYAVDHDVNFFDTAELYPVPPKAETVHRTETMIGNWFTKSGKRGDVVLASKVVGNSPGMTWIREGKQEQNHTQIMEALENSLKRLQTDCIDLYQLHWPDRPVPKFGRRGWQNEPDPFNPEGDQEVYEERFLETLRTLDTCRQQGKIRHIGLSNESPWGTMRYLQLAEEHYLPRVVSVQNPYNLLDRTYEYGMAEVSIREKCGLLAYSPLAAGALSGKYIDGARPTGARWSIDHRPSRYNKPNGEKAVKDYLAIAKKYNLDPCQMALAFVNSRPFLTSTIIGATKMEQLKTNIASHDLVLPQDCLEEIDAVHENNPNPCP